MKMKPFLYETKQNCTFSACGLTLDFSRQRLSKETWEKLLCYAKNNKVIDAQIKMMKGDTVNTSEKRQALHTSLRSRDPEAPYYEKVQHELNRMKRLARDVRSGLWRGATGKKITDVINIGIGGSEMGPHAVYHALRANKPQIRLHFLSAVDGSLLDRVLSKVKPETTLIVISSKSFLTSETLLNAQAADSWLARAGIYTFGDRARHILVVSARGDAFKAMNVPHENQFNFWDWVGGRFSVWSAVGLPLLITLGDAVFQDFLDGAYEMDKHLKSAPLEQNLPLVLALLSFYSHNQLGLRSHCMLPYDERLRLIVDWLQQLEMESLGKAHTSENESVEGVTGQAVWGGVGNEAQHSFYQWLREGLVRTSIGIIWCKESGHFHDYHHRVLVANAKAQAQALIEVEREDTINAVSTLVLDSLTPKILGSLMAMYEHKVTILGSLYGINAFDQPGVELGKKLLREYITKS